jgi:hypothetical protein
VYHQTPLPNQRVGHVRNDGRAQIATSRKTDAVKYKAQSSGTQCSLQAIPEASNLLALKRHSTCLGIVDFHYEDAHSMCLAVTAESIGTTR